MPCLLYTSESAGDNIACMYSIAEKRLYKLTLPEPSISSWYLIGSSNGWLVTGEHIALPSEHLQQRVYLGW
jgi:hypothetical protein